MPTYATKKILICIFTKKKKKKSDITKQRLEYKKENHICDI